MGNANCPLWRRQVTTPNNDLVLTNLSDVPDKDEKVTVKVSNEGQGTSADGIVRYGPGPGRRASVRKRKDEAMKGKVKGQVKVMVRLKLLIL